MIKRRVIYAADLTCGAVLAVAMFEVVNFFTSSN